MSRREEPSISPLLSLVRDPVCGMEITPINPQAQSEWNGHIVCFCSEDCQRRFERDPRKYVSLMLPTQPAQKPT